jgi:hypothetical protein
MPRYFFDMYDDHNLTEDDKGLDLEGVEAVRIEALGALPAIAREIITLHGDRRTIMVRVRDETGRNVLNAALAVVVEVEP